MGKKENITRSLTFPKDLYQKIGVLAENDFSNITQYILRVLNDHVKEKEKTNN